MKCLYTNVRHKVTSHSRNRRMTTIHMHMHVVYMWSCCDSELKGGTILRIPFKTYNIIEKKAFIGELLMLTIVIYKR